MGSCLNHGLRRLHGGKSLDGRDLEKISIGLTNHSLDGQWLVTSKSGGDRGRMEGGSEKDWKTGKRENE